jgi:hypothetical protein
MATLSALALTKQSLIHGFKSPSTFTPGDRFTVHVHRQTQQLTHGERGRLYARVYIAQTWLIVQVILNVCLSTQFVNYGFLAETLLSTSVWNAFLAVV